MLAVVCYLSACTGPALKPDMSKVADQTTQYQEGFHDGCHSGYVSGGSLYNNFKRDSKRMKEDNQYRLGWNRGYKVCKDDFRDMCREGGVLSKATLYCSDVKQQGLDKID